VQPLYHYYYQTAGHMCQFQPAGLSSAVLSEDNVGMPLKKKQLSSLGPPRLRSSNVSA